MMIAFNCLTIVAMDDNKRTSETIGLCCAEVQVHPQGSTVSAVMVASSVGDKVQCTTYTMKLINAHPNKK
jgi:hypothetical protein